MSGKGLTPTSSQRGHVLLVVIILTILMALSLSMAFRPLRMQLLRQKETQLIYRGEHLAKGIRGYYFRYGRFPHDLEELLGADPRLVRQIYKDPMTESGEWELVYLGKESLSTVQKLQEDLFPGGGEKFNSQALLAHGQQIIGIRSKSTETGYKTYQYSQIHNDWFFNALQGMRRPIKQQF